MRVQVQLAIAAMNLDKSRARGHFNYKTFGHDEFLILLAISTINKHAFN
jgi:hypothetical protein